MSYIRLLHYPFRPLVREHLDEFYSSSGDWDVGRVPLIYQYEAVIVHDVVFDFEKLQ